MIIECRHLANGCVLQSGCIGLVLFHNLSCMDTIICYINTIGIVPAYACNVCDALVASYATTDKLSTDCVHASSVNMFKNKIDKYLAKAGYT